MNAQPQVAGPGAAALQRNSELAEIEAAFAAAEAERAPGAEEAEHGGGAESAGEGDLEDDFITAVLDAESGPSDEEQEEAEQEGPESDGGDEAELQRSAELGVAAARARAARAQRPLDAAFDALAQAEYSDTDIGCVPPAGATALLSLLTHATQGFGPRRGCGARHV